MTLLTANEIVMIPKDEIEERAAERPVDDARRPLEAALRARGPVARRLPRQPGAGADAGDARERRRASSTAATWPAGTATRPLDGRGRRDRRQDRPGSKRNEFLRSEMVAEDFRLRLKVKLVGNEGNSGIQFRSEALPDGEMKGYQADVGPGWWGKLYEENGRGLLWPKSGEAVSSNPASGTTTRSSPSAARSAPTSTASLASISTTPPGARRGIFAFQLHSGGPTEVRFRDIRLEVNPKIGEPVSSRPPGSR